MMGNDVIEDHQRERSPLDGLERPLRHDPGAMHAPYRHSNELATREVPIDRDSTGGDISGRGRIAQERISAHARHRSPVFHSLFPRRDT